MGNKGSQVIVLLGPYGSGKSQFVDTLTQSTNWANHTLEPDKHPQIRKTLTLDKTVVLVDTPGFDDQTRSIDSVLTEIEVWMAKKKILKNDIKVTILYFHRIMEKRLVIKPPISTFKRFCRDDFVKRFIFVTTHWDCVSLQYGQAQEQTLRNYLQHRMGSVRMERSNMTIQAAQDIILALP